MSNNKGTRTAAGSGCVRQRKNGRWEGRVTVGRDPLTGRQVQRAVYGATQGEVRKKLAALITEVDTGTYKAPSKLTVGEWMEIWLKTYNEGWKPFTVEIYTNFTKLHIIPNIGHVRLDQLATHTIQGFYNGLRREGKLSPSSIKLLHGVLHRALEQARLNGLIKTNPANSCKLPRAAKPDLKPLDESGIKAFLTAVKGHRWERLFLLAVATGLRRGELLGLCWKDIDFSKGVIYVRQQLLYVNAGIQFGSLKNGKPRTLTPPPLVFAALKEQRAIQAAQRLKAGSAWQDWQAAGLVFTNEIGLPVTPSVIYYAFKKIVVSIGSPETRFHDLRHSYAVAALRAGDDPKTISENLGHATVAFTLDRYAFVTAEMKRDSAERMEKYLNALQSQ